VKSLLLVSILSIFIIGCSGGRNSTGYSLINDMMHSLAYESYSENHLFDNGQTMQPPPENTIPRGFMPHPMDANGNPVVLENPYEMNDYKWQRAELLFNRTCSACHGVDGQGGGKVVTQGGFPAPPKFKSRTFKYSKKERKPSGHIYNVISFGYGNMPAHAQQLYPEDRWAVSEYVRERLMTRGKKD
jgi:mono/diheme cytochrome c family protein